MTKRADILSLLKEEKDFLEKQLKKVVTAIAAFSEEEKNGTAAAGKKRGPKPRKSAPAPKAATGTGKKRGRKPKSATPAPEENAAETVGSPELG